jgi:hypothetical protein
VTSQSSLETYWNLTLQAWTSADNLSPVDDSTAPPAALYARPTLDERSVRTVLESLGVTSVPTDLGGTMSLNLHLEELGLVLRVHPRFESLDRLHALRALRRTLEAGGARVGVPQPLFGR